MGRKKRYDRDVLIQRAVDIFRDHGFAGTSAEMLVEGLGVNRFTIYAEFGSKQGLFDSALQRYDQLVVERNFGPLELPEAGIDDVRSLLEFFGTASDAPAWGRGCLLCNTAVEFGPTDPSDNGLVQNYFERLSNAFANALKNAIQTDDLPRSVDPSREAHFFTASVLGLFVMLRAKAPPRAIEGAANAALAHLTNLEKK